MRPAGKVGSKMNTRWKVIFSVVKCIATCLMIRIKDSCVLRSWHFCWKFTPGLAKLYLERGKLKISPDGQGCSAVVIDVHKWVNEQCWAHNEVLHVPGLLSVRPKNWGFKPVLTIHSVFTSPHFAALVRLILNKQTQILNFNRLF